MITDIHGNTEIQHTLDTEITKYKMTQKYTYGPLSQLPVLRYTLWDRNTHVGHCHNYSGIHGETETHTWATITTTRVYTVRQKYTRGPLSQLLGYTWWDRNTHVGHNYNYSGIHGETEIHTWATVTTTRVYMVTQKYTRGPLSQLLGYTWWHRNTHVDHCHNYWYSGIHGETEYTRGPLSQLLGYTWWDRNTYPGHRPLHTDTHGDTKIHTRVTITATDS